MTTDKKIAANRRNAQFSTGPVTAAGKARSSLNALVHGFSSPVEATLRDDQSRRQFAEFRQHYLDVLEPAGQCELTEVERLVRSRWQLGRVAPLEATVVDVEHVRLALNHDHFQQLSAKEQSAVVSFSLVTGPDLFQANRWTTTFRHQYRRAAAELDRLQNIRRSNEELPCDLPLAA